MDTQTTGECLVCGTETKNRCSACTKAGLDLFFCSPEHQKLVWSPHKLVCGPGKANPWTCRLSTWRKWPDSPGLPSPAARATLEGYTSANLDNNGCATLSALRDFRVFHEGSRVAKKAQPHDSPFSGLARIAVIYGIFEDTSGWRCELLHRLVIANALFEPLREPNADLRLRRFHDSSVTLMRSYINNVVAPTDPECAKCILAAMDLMWFASRMASLAWDDY
ncbi:hypothetical protein NBRC10513_006314 [Rhodotorula toruloides]